MRIELEGRIEEVEVCEKTKKNLGFNRGYICDRKIDVIVADAGSYEGYNCLFRFDTTRKHSSTFPLGHFVSSYVPKDFIPLEKEDYVLIGMWPGRTIGRNPPTPEELRKFFCPGNLHRYLMLKNIDGEDKMFIVDTRSIVPVKGEILGLLDRYMSNLELTRFIMTDNIGQLTFASNVLESHGLNVIKTGSIDANRIGGRLEYANVLEKMSDRNTVGFIPRTSDYVIIRRGDLDEGDRLVVKVDHDKHPSYSRLFASIVCRELPDNRDSLRCEEYVLIARWPYVNTDPMSLKLEKINQYFDPGRSGWVLYVQDNGRVKPMYHVRHDSVTKRHIPLNCVADISNFLPNPRERPRLVVCSSDYVLEEVRKNVEDVGLVAVEMKPYSLC